MARVHRPAFEQIQAISEAHHMKVVAVMDVLVEAWGQMSESARAKAIRAAAKAKERHNGRRGATPGGTES